MRSLYDHFHEISDLERQHLDLREYRLFFTGSAKESGGKDNNKNEEQNGEKPKNISASI